ncbi:MAG TPA: class I SAM-dependent methyltransferase [Solirubrobacteraceae bacterium]|nr:class I SAM-dependent methyltransferase [Solirubrobacteraceae bacterium]
MDVDELERRIAEFLHWDYRFEFDNGATTPLLDRRMVNRHEKRRHYFFDPLVGLFGGSLSGQRVLDLGCGQGFWSLHAIEAGADFVLALDADGTSIDQAKLVFEAKGIEPARYTFEQGDFFERRPSGSFDIALCLGVMHLVAKPFELFELMRDSGAEVIVIETDLSDRGGSSFEVDEVRKPVDHSIALVPTRQAVAELAGEFGYQTVPLALNMADFTGMLDYHRRQRLAFFCSSGRSLDALRAEEPWLMPWWAAPLEQRLRRIRS